MKKYIIIHRSYLKPSFNLVYTAAHGITLLLVVSAFYLINLPPDKMAHKPLILKKTTHLQSGVSTNLPHPTYQNR